MPVSFQGAPMDLQCLIENSSRELLAAVDGFSRPNRLTPPPRARLFTTQYLFIFENEIDRNKDGHLTDACPSLFHVTCGVVVSVFNPPVLFLCMNVREEGMGKVCEVVCLSACDTLFACLLVLASRAPPLPPFALISVTKVRDETCSLPCMRGRSHWAQSSMGPRRLCWIRRSAGHWEI